MKEYFRNPVTIASFVGLIVSALVLYQIYYLRLVILVAPVFFYNGGIFGGSRRLWVTLHKDEPKEEMISGFKRFSKDYLLIWGAVFVTSLITVAEVQLITNNPTVGLLVGGGVIIIITLIILKRTW